VQLSRRKGWRKPPNTVVVARPTKWGNPFTVREHGWETAVQWFANWLTNTVDEHGRYVHGDTDYHGAESSTRPSVEEIRQDLAGKNLACWCPLDRPCHADVLLAIANGGVQ
jgi:hypothetical protein